SDSFSLENSVDILPAPRPGMVVSAKSGCTPFELTAKRTYTDDAVDLTWNFGDGSAPQIVTPSSTTSHTYLTAGSFWLTQTLLGSTGCITRDTQLIAVQQGFDPSYVPLLIRASVEPADSVEVEWMSNPLAKSYVVFQNQKVVDSTLNNYWKGGYDIPQALYNVRAQNVCGNLSTSSNIGKLIELSGQQQNNEVALLQWSAYEDWALGIARYEVETYVEDPTQLVQSPFAILSTNDSSNRSYSDLGYKTDGAAQKCYRIRAISAANAKVISYSNVVCLPYQPVFFVPSAFSPNNDGLNDQFSVYSLGIKSFEIEIFNRWGELVYRGQRWDGKIDGSIAPLGAYLFTIQGRTAEDKIVSRFGSVMLVE
ncbi:MAG: gliding motility-associated-like protein, partial [Bacteroidia bacterium]